MGVSIPNPDSMKNPVFLKNLFSPIILLAFLVGFLFADEAAAQNRPNVVLIISDDHAWGDYGFMGHEHIKTPHLDRLAEQSLLMTRGYVPVSLCRPSLASMATGLYPHQHWITGNDPNPAARDAAGGRPAADQPYVDRMAELPTIARLLGEVGYLSHQSGKWWEGHPSVGGFTHAMTHGDPTRGGRHGDVGLAIGRSGMEPVFEFIEHAVDEEKPFFVWYAPFLPHTPHNPPDRLLEKYTAAGRPIELARYYAMVDWFDETCGELLNYIDGKGLGDNTIILYVTDNGWIQLTPDMEVPGTWRKEGYGPRSKRSPHEGGIRTPIMVRWTGQVEPLRDDQNLASSIDLMPTILRAVGLEPSADLPGINLLNRGAVEARDAVFGDIYGHDMPAPIEEPLKGIYYRWVIARDWKLIAPNPDLAPEVFVGDSIVARHEGIELYNLKEDPHEMNNLAKEQPGRVRRLQDRLDDWLPLPDVGFKPIFNGKNLDGWKGDRGLWRVEDGMIVGKTTADAPLKSNTFLIWSEGEPADFELRFQYRIVSESANSGVQVRSQVLDGGVVAGYQPDIATVDWITGILYEEKGRGILARRGQRIRIDSQGEKHVERFAEEADLFQHIAPHDAWTDYQVTAKGNTLRTKINGALMHELIDESDKARSSGVIAFQLHTGPPMEIHFRDIKLKTLESGRR